MPTQTTGHHYVTAVAGERVAAFMPVPLPPADPPLALAGELGERLRRAEAALLRLEFASAMAPSLPWFTYAFVRKEAVLLLEHWGLLRAPLLYLSLFFKRHRSEYYRRLDAVRGDGDWEGWLDFFLDGVATTADEAVATARSLSELVAEDRARVLGSKSSTLAAIRLFEQLPEHPLITVAKACKLLGASKPTAGRAVEALEQAGVLAETSGRRRDRLFAYQRYVDLLREGTEG